MTSFDAPLGTEDVAAFPAHGLVCAIPCDTLGLAVEKGDIPIPVNGKNTEGDAVQNQSQFRGIDFRIHGAPQTDAW